MTKAESRANDVNFNINKTGDQGTLNANEHGESPDVMADMKCKTAAGDDNLQVEYTGVDTDNLQRDVKNFTTLKNTGGAQNINVTNPSKIFLF